MAGTDVSTPPTPPQAAAVAPPPPPPPPPPATATASPPLSDTLLARLLGFFAEASNGTLAGCFAGLLLVVVVLFGRIGFVLVGVVTGFVLHALWPDTLPLPHRSSGLSRRKGARHWEESGCETARRILDWRTERASDIAAAAAATSATTSAATTGNESLKDGAPDRVVDAATADKSLDFSRLPPQTAAALASLTDAVIRDYVSYVCFAACPT